MKYRILAPFVAGVAAVSALAGCSAFGATRPVELAGPSTTPDTTTAPSATARHSTAPNTGPDATQPGAASASASASVFPPGEPPRPGVPPAWPKPESVPGLADAIRSAEHPGLQICGGALDSFVIASGDLRGDGSTQYLVDTTCDGATATTPDEVSLYEPSGSVIGRSAVLYEFTANRPRTTASPYMWGAHTVALTYGGGTEYRLVELTPNAVVSGLVTRF